MLEFARKDVHKRSLRAFSVTERMLSPSNLLLINSIFVTENVLCKPVQLQISNKNVWSVGRTQFEKPHPRIFLSHEKKKKRCTKTFDRYCTYCRDILYTSNGIFSLINFIHHCCQLPAFNLSKFKNSLVDVIIQEE